MNLKWPATKTNGKVPWYTILRQSAMWPMLFAGILIVATAALLGWGRKECRAFIREDLGW